MNKTTVLEALGQVESCEAGEIFREFIRESVRSSYMDVMIEEVNSLCGPKYHPPEGAPYHRAGSTPGSCFVDGHEERVLRPRVRCGKGVASKEAKLASYEVARNGDEIKNAILRALRAGVSSRDQVNLYPDSPLVSKSQVSRLWVKEGLKCVEKLKGRNIAEEKFFALMLDGIGLGNDLLAVVALGITCDGRKIIMDFQIGASENFEVCNDLIKRLKVRGFKAENRLYAVFDGAKSLKKAIVKHFPDAVIQRCIIHKERNVKSYLSRRHHGAVGGYFARLRKAQGPEAAREIYNELHKFLSEKNKQALESLEEAGEDIIALHLINVPSTLNVSLLSTNCIENPFRNVRAKIGRVKRWRTETDQAECWLAYGLLEAEKGFRRIRGYKDIPKLIEQLQNPVSPSQPHAAGKGSPGGNSTLGSDEERKAA